MLDRDWIAAHIPHHGAMCLLDAVVDWSAATISCRAVSHTDPANPLRADGRLGAAIGIEYAAQAMAVHGALLADAAEASDADNGPRHGYLTSLRGVTLHVAQLDDLAGELSIYAERVAGDGQFILYRFSLGHAGRCLVEGRATVVLDAGAMVSAARS